MSVTLPSRRRRLGGKETSYHMLFGANGTRSGTKFNAEVLTKIGNQKKCIPFDLDFFISGLQLFGLFYLQITEASLILSWPTDCRSVFSTFLSIPRECKRLKHSSWSSRDLFLLSIRRPWPRLRRRQALWPLRRLLWCLLWCLCRRLWLLLGAGGGLSGWRPRSRWRLWLGPRLCRSSVSKIQSRIVKKKGGGKVRG